MADKEKEKAPEASQTEKKPNSRFSEQEETQSSAQALKSFEEFSERYGPALDDYLDRKFQSFKDTRLGTHETEIEQIKQEQTDIRQTLSQFQELKDEGWTDAQAIRLMEQNKSEPQPAQESKPQASDGTESEQDWMDREQAVLDKVGIDQDDDRFIEFIRETNEMSDDEYVQELKSRSRQWRNADLTKPQPSSSTAANTARTESQPQRQFSDKSAEELGAEVDTLMKSPRKHKEQIDEIVAELERRDTD